MIPTWSVMSSLQRSWRTTLVTVEPLSACDLYGVTTSSYFVETTVYEGGGGASWPALSFFMKSEPAACSAHAGQPSPPSGGARARLGAWPAGAPPPGGARDVAAQHAALRVPDERHLRGARPLPHLVDERGQLVGRLVDRRHAAVDEVEREDAVVVLHEQRRQLVPRHGHVAELAMHEDHRHRVLRRAAREVVRTRRR